MARVSRRPSIGGRRGGVRSGLATVLLLGAILLVAARLFTCIVILADDPTTYLALKRHPSAASMVRIGDEPVRRDYILLDGDENQLVYEKPYLSLMAHAGASAAASLASGLAILLWPRRRFHSPS